MKASQPLCLLVRQLRPSLHLPPSFLSARFFSSYPPRRPIKKRHQLSPTSSNERVPISAALQARYISVSAANTAPALPASKPQVDESKPPILNEQSSSTSTVPNFRALPPSATRSETIGSSTATSVSFPLADRPSYQITFTCKPCLHRSTHTMTKQGYHHGTVLITCPSCKNRHVISDHLKIFADLSFTVEDLMRDKGELVKRGSIGHDGDIEFWMDEKGGKEG